MAECGPSNPLKSFTNSADRASQDERYDSRPGLIRGNFRTAESVNHNVSQQYSQFNQGPAGSFVPMAEHINHSLHHPTERSHVRPPAGFSNWADEFKNQAAFQPASFQASHRQPLEAPALRPMDAAFHPQYSQGVVNTNPALSAYSTSPAMAQMSEHRQMHAASELDKAFEEAFASVEIGENIPQQEPQRQNEETHTKEPHNDAEFANIAQQILISVKEADVSSQTSSKLAQSQFMSLMQLVSSKNVTLGDHKFVDSEGKEVDVQRDIEEVSTPKETFSENRENQPSPRQGAGPASLGHLGDPIDYAESLGITDLTSNPFAKEEDYDSWAE